MSDNVYSVYSISNCNSIAAEQAQALEKISKMFCLCSAPRPFSSRLPKCFLLALLLWSLTALGAAGGTMGRNTSLWAVPPIKRRINVAVIIPGEYATLSMLLVKHTNLLKKRIGRVRGQPRIKIRLIAWKDFMQNNGYITFDAVIYIALYNQLPSDMATTLSNEHGRSFLELLEAPIFSKFTQPKRFIWLLFKQTAQLNQYRLRYPKSQYSSSNTGKAAMRKIFEADLFRFLLRLRELYF